MKISSDLDLATMKDFGNAIVCRQADLPYSEVILFHGGCRAIPVVCRTMSICVQLSMSGGLLLTEVSNKVCIGCIGSPFSICDIAILVDVETELLEALFQTISLFREAVRAPRDIR